MLDEIMQEVGQEVFMSEATAYLYDGPPDITLQQVRQRHAAAKYAQPLMMDGTACVHTASCQQCFELDCASTFESRSQHSCIFTHVA
jgi:hypothetical protein